MLGKKNWSKMKTKLKIMMGFSQVNLISMVEERKQREKEAKKLEEEK